MILGSCLCGQVQFEVHGPLRPVVNCHCVQCRKTSGHHVAATSAARDEVAITGDVTWYHASKRARRGFCGVCGSSLFWDGAGANLSIHAGALDGVTGLRSKGHIYCDTKGDYYELSDDLPKAPGYDPEMTTMVK